MSQLTQDIRFAARSLARQPVFLLTAVLTLALGIGANSAIFSVVDSVLLVPPPFSQPDRIAVAWGENHEAEEAFGFKDLPITIGSFYDWQRETKSFDKLALLQSDRMTLTGQGDPEQLGVVKVAGDFFGVLGTPALLGRTLEPSDDVPGKPQAVVLSYNYWQRRFGGDRGVIDKTLIINGNQVPVVGVMPPRFAFPRGGSEIHPSYSFAADPDVWLPFALSEEGKQDRGNRFSFAIGRLKDGVTIQSAEDELKAVSTRLAERYPESDHGWSAFLVPVRDQMAGGLKPVLMVLWAAVGFVLLIACVNVANLLLARAASRQKEIALRTAIGAGRTRLISQLLTESGLISLLGGALGVALAWVALRACAVWVPAGTAGAATFALNGRVLLFALLLCAVTTALAGLIPAFQMTRPDLGGTLREGTRSGAGTQASRRTRAALVVLEIAFAVVLLIGAGLLLRSFVTLLAVQPGFEGSQALTFRIDLPPEGFSPEQRVAFFDRVADKLESLPAVQSAGMMSALPMTGAEQFVPVSFENRPLPKPGEMWSVGMYSVTPGYHKAMGIPLLSGRFLDRRDVKGAALVAVIDEQMAKVYWPGEDPIGKRFRFGTRPEYPLMTVVGVVGSIRHSNLQSEPIPQVYVTVAQTPDFLIPYWVWMVARVQGDPQAVITPARNAVHEVDANQPVTQFLTMDEVVAQSVAPRRFSLLLLALFAGLALVLACIGIYGITAYSVTQRTREMGLRMALGAQPREVVWLVVREAGLLAGLGVILGLIAAAVIYSKVLSVWLSSLLYKVGAIDPITFVAVAVGLALVALIAAYLPGRRATRVSPMVALRAE
jgi:putative ABC transport system permease protein